MKDEKDGKRYFCFDCLELFDDAETGEEVTNAVMGARKIEIQYTERLRICPKCGAKMFDGKLENISDDEMMGKYNQKLKKLLQDN